MMVPLRVLAVIGFGLTATPASSSTIVATYANVGDAERAVVDAAISRWQALLPGPFVFALTIESGFLGGTLASSSRFVERGGVPISAHITFDDGTGGTPWFIDQTPLDDAEFGAGRHAFHAEARAAGPAAGAFDLLTVIQHELGHALGFTVFYGAFAARVTDAPDGNRTYTGASVSARLTGAGGGTHTLPEIHPFDLLNPELEPGHRMNPSPLDLAVLSDAYGYTALPAVPLEPVPEPPAGLLTALACLVVGCCRRLTRRT